jgi:hypothetical protein
MESNKEINNNNEFDDCLIPTQDDSMDSQPNDKEDIPVTEEENQTVNELLDGGDIEERTILREDYEECKKFYTKLRGFNKYDLTENNFKYWKGKPYVGSGYREFIKKSSKIMVCTALVNERIQINLFDKLIQRKKKGEKPIDKGLLRYIEGNLSYSNVLLKNDNFFYKKSKDFLEWRFKSHLYRFGFIKKYLQDEYQLDYNDFKIYKDVENYFKLIVN